MTKRPARNHIPAFKARAAVCGEKTLAELAQQFDMHSNQFTQRRSQLVYGAAGVFGLEPSAAPAAPVIDVKTLRARASSLKLESGLARRAVADSLA